LRTDNGGVYQLDPFADEIMQEVWESRKFVNWEELMLKPDWIQKYDVSVRTGSENTKVATSIGYFKQDGMVEKSGLERGTFRLNLDQKLGKKINLGTNFAYTRSKRQVADGTFNSFITAPPLAKPYDDNGELQLWIINSASNEGINPLWNIREYDEEHLVDRFLMSTFVDWEIISGLKYRITANIDYRGTEIGSYQSKLHRSGAGKKGHGELTNSTNFEYLIDNTLSYSKTFANIHHIDLVAIQSANRARSKSLKVIGEQFASDYFKWNGIPDAELILKPERNITQRSLMSFAGRLQYNLMDKYLLTATLRRDGSSVFGSAHQWGTFPSVALAWKIHQENFFSNLNWLNSLKLRLGYGQVGNQAVSTYQTLGVANNNQMLFGDGTLETGFLPSATLHNPYLQWETTESTNVGLDLGFLKNRISGTVDYYVRNTIVLLINRSLNNVLGYDNITTNIGQVQNKGVEVMLSGDIIRETDFKWRIDLTFSANKNKIVALSGKLDKNGKPVDDVSNNWFIGYPIQVYYDYKFGGIWQLDNDIANSHMPNAKPGDVIRVDVSGPDGVPDNKITAENDRVKYSRDPDWYGSLTSNFSWKWFDLMLDFYTLQGGTFKNPYMYDSNMGGSLQGVRNGIKVNYWTPENPSNTFPRPRRTSPDTNIDLVGYQNQSYIRLRAATLGFNFPKKWLSDIKLSNARFYVTGSNLWTKTDILSYSPEADTGSYPEASSVIFGLIVSF
jgi:TonB-linked SusC/RagA family outer membrane protein